MAGGGTPTTKALQEALMSRKARMRGVGLRPRLSAITHTLLAVLKAAIISLVCDNAYRPDAKFLRRVARRLWCRTTYFDP